MRAQNLHLISCTSPIHLPCSLSGTLSKKTTKGKFPVKLTTWIEILRKPDSESVFIISDNHSNFIFTDGSAYIVNFSVSLTNNSIFEKSHVILKKRSCTSVLHSHIKGNFTLNRTFLGKNQQVVRWLFNQISSSRMTTHQRF